MRVLNRQEIKKTIKTAAVFTAVCLVFASLSACGEKSVRDDEKLPLASEIIYGEPEYETTQAQLIVEKVKGFLENDNPLGAAKLLEEAIDFDDEDREFYASLLDGVRAETALLSECGEYNYPDGSNYYWEYTYNLDGHKLHAEDSYMVQDYTYDESGNMLSYVYRDAQTLTYAGGYSYEYDKSGNKISETLLMEDGTQIMHTDFTYDGEGRQLSRTEYYGDKAKFKEEWTYFSDGDVKTCSSVDYETKYHTFSEYDQQGSCTENKWWYEKGESSTSKVSIQYDKRDNVISRISKLNGRQQSKDTYEYVYDEDGSGNLIHVLRYNTSSKDKVFDYEEVYEYDNQNRLVKLLTYDNESHISYTEKTWDYDSDGVCTEHITNYVGATSYDSWSCYTADGTMLWEVTDGERTDYYYNALGHVIELRLNGSEYAHIDREYTYKGTLN